MACNKSEPKFYWEQGGYYNAVGNVLKLLKGFGEQTHKVIQELLEGYADGNDVDLKKMEEKGFIIHNDGVYAITELGKEAFREA